MAPNKRPNAASNYKIDMKIWALLLISFLAIGLLRADDKIAGVQQALKDQGFYYGEITGEKNADTTAAVRRFQIRNGLQITGELNEETLKALRSNPSVASSPVASAPPIARAPTPVPQTAQPSQNDAGATAERDEPPSPYYPAPSQDRQSPPVYPGRVAPAVGENFIGTPFQNAPPEVLRRLIVDAQKILARHGLFKSEITGVFGPDLEFSLRAYQSRVGLESTGRLDLETLAALELLPGAHEPVYTPRRIFRQPPVRGEWIHP